MDQHRSAISNLKLISAHVHSVEVNLCGGNRKIAFTFRIAE